MNCFSSNTASAMMRTRINTLASRSNTELLRTNTANRTFTSSTYVQGRGITEKGKERERQKHDSKLRHAIDLYHVSHNFYPTKPTFTGQMKIGIDIQENESSSNKSKYSSIDMMNMENTVENDEIKLHSFDEELDWIVRANLLMMNHTSFTGGLIHMRTDGLVVEKMEEARRNNEAPFQKNLLDINFSPSSLNDSSVYGRSSRIREKEIPLPDVNDPESVKDYISEAVRRTANAQRSNDGIAPGHAELDSRSARVRDALFGTVQGSLPGLEVIRERSKDPRVREAAKRLISEAEEAKKARNDQKGTESKTN